MTLSYQYVMQLAYGAAVVAARRQQEGYRFTYKGMRFLKI